MYFNDNLNTIDNDITKYVFEAPHYLALYKNACQNSENWRHKSTSWLSYY